MMRYKLVEVRVALLACLALKSRTGGSARRGCNKESGLDAPTSTAGTSSLEVLAIPGDARHGVAAVLLAAHHDAALGEVVKRDLVHAEKALHRRR